MKYSDIAIIFPFKASSSTTVGKMADIFKKIDTSYCPVLDASENVMGVIAEKKLMHALHSKQLSVQASIEVLVDTDFCIVRGEDTVHFHHKHKYILVISDGSILGMIKGELLKLCSSLGEEQNAILSSIQNGIVAIDEAGIINFFNSSSEKITGIRAKNAVGKYINTVIPSSQLLEVKQSGKKVSGQRQEINGRVVITNRSPIVKNNKIVGAVGVFQDIGDVEQVSRELEHVKALNCELEAIMDNAYDLITIVDGSGVALRANSALEKMFGIKMENFVGKNVSQLERDGVVSRSVTSLVLQTKKRQTLIQDTKSGRRLAVTGVPIFDSEEKLYRVVNFSRDITELSRLKHQLEETEEILKNYRHELNELRSEKKHLSLIARGPQMKKLVELVKRVAQVDSTVLVLGESGVGKEVIAKAIHDMSTRNNGPFIKINCCAIPETLLESELFGYEKGAFTGAGKGGKRGLALLANHGTLFLDEIGDLPPSLQPKVLQLIQEQTFYPVGSSVPIKVDTRIITATHRNLKKMVEQGSFRDDLYYRLNVVPIQIPPLRERREEIPVLTAHFLQKFCEKYLQNKKFSPEALELLLHYNWPGNVRELENITERLVVLTDGEVIHTRHLPSELRKDTGGTDGIPLGDKEFSLEDEVAAYEKKILLQAFEKYTKTHLVAKALGMHRSTVVRKVNKHFGDDPEILKALRGDQ